MVAGFLAFKGEDEINQSSEVLLELTSVYKDGTVEIAANIPIKDHPRIYLRFDLGDLVMRATRRDTNEE